GHATTRAAVAGRARGRCARVGDDAPRDARPALLDGRVHRRLPGADLRARAERGGGAVAVAVDRAGAHADLRELRRRVGDVALDVPAGVRAAEVAVRRAWRRWVAQSVADGARGARARAGGAAALAG